MSRPEVHWHRELNGMRDLADLHRPVLIGTTRAGTKWVFYPDRHKLKDLEIMIQRLSCWGGEPTWRALDLLEYLRKEGE